MTYVALSVSRGPLLSGKVWCGQGVKAPDRLIAVAIVGRVGSHQAISDVEDYGPWSPDTPREAMETGALLMATKHHLDFGAFE